MFWRLYLRECYRYLVNPAHHPTALKYRDQNVHSEGLRNNRINAGIRECCQIVHGDNLCRGKWKRVLKNNFLTKFSHLFVLELFFGQSLYVA